MKRRRCCIAGVWLDSIFADLGNYLGRSGVLYLKCFFCGMFGIKTACEDGGGWGQVGNVIDVESEIRGFINAYYDER